MVAQSTRRGAIGKIFLNLRAFKFFFVSKLNLSTSAGNFDIHSDSHSLSSLKLNLPWLKSQSYIPEISPFLLDNYVILCSVHLMLLFIFRRFSTSFFPSLEFTIT